MARPRTASFKQLNLTFEITGIWWGNTHTHRHPCLHNRDTTLENSRQSVVRHANIHIYTYTCAAGLMVQMRQTWNRKLRLLDTFANYCEPCGQIQPNSRYHTQCIALRICIQDSNTKLPRLFTVEGPAHLIRNSTLCNSPCINKRQCCTHRALNQPAPQAWQS